MSPELVILRHGDKEKPGYGKAVDCWAIGVILYILLSGIHPFQIDDEEEMLLNIEKGEWEWIGDQWDNVSEDAKDLIIKLIDPNHETRYTIDQALAHPWITGSNTTTTKSLNAIKDNMRKFQARKKLRGAIFSVIATNRLKRSLDNLKRGILDSDDSIENKNEEINNNNS